MHICVYSQEIFEHTEYEKLNFVYPAYLQLNSHQTRYISKPYHYADRLLRIEVYKIGNSPAQLLHNAYV
jgi:hypothetical protein